MNYILGTLAVAVVMLFLYTKSLYNDNKQLEENNKLIVTAFMLVLVLRTFNFNIIISWNEFYLYIVSFTSISIILYSIWLRYLKKCK